MRMATGGSVITMCKQKINNFFVGNSQGRKYKDH